MLFNLIFSTHLNYSLAHSMNKKTNKIRNFAIHRNVTCICETIHMILSSTEVIRKMSNTPLFQLKEEKKKAKFEQLCYETVNKTQKKLVPFSLNACVFRIFAYQSMLSTRKYKTFGTIEKLKRIYYMTSSHLTMTIYGHACVSVVCEIIYIRN